MPRKTPDEWFAEYAQSHQNPLNKAIHWVCVPVIAGCVIGFFWSLPRPVWMADLPWLNWGVVAIGASLLFYVRLSWALAWGMLAFSSLVVGMLVAWEACTSIPVWQPTLALFVLAWCGQFVGHGIEGRKPSFLQDLQFLLIGPIWLLSFIYRRCGVRYE